jgi:hypothetical protein
MNKKEPLKIPLDFKQTVLAALETKPEPRKKAKRKARPRPESSSDR